ncbi:MAG: deoxyribose-phosphate aldolase [Bacteroidales bacterium]
MTDFSLTPEIKDEDVKQRTEQLLDIPEETLNLPEVYKDILGMIDLTTLEGADTRKKVEDLCVEAQSFSSMQDGLPDVAAVCVYPPFVAPARKALEDSNIQTASVAGAFPSGQSPLFVKMAEVRYAVDEGAQEIDMVISRGKFLEGEYNLVFDEIAAIKEACKTAHLKVILETGELETATNIRRASEIALKAGGDFLKTSTGKIKPAATPEAMLVMLEAIREHHKKTGHMTGMKPAGGISDPATALSYYWLTRKVLGKKWLTKKYLRFGASRLANTLVEAIRSAKTA